MTFEMQNKNFDSRILSRLYEKRQYIGMKMSNMGQDLPNNKVDVQFCLPNENVSYNW